MTIDNIVLALTFIASAVALFFSIRKQKHDVNKVDADTIASLFQTVRELGKENKEIRLEFAEYKRVTSAQLGELSSEIVRYRKWAKRLVTQLDSAGIAPARFEDC
jgi:ABC-type transporter Mla MlaB component